MTYLVPGMVYRMDGEMVPDTSMVIRIHRDLAWNARCLWSFRPVGAYSNNVGRPLVDGEIGIIGNCVIAVADAADAVTDFHAVKDKVFPRCRVPTLADSMAQKF